MESSVVSKGKLLAGRIISGLVVLFLVFDGVTKLMRVPQVMQASIQLGFPDGTIVGIGATLLVCTAIYVIPRTAVFGAILLTAYLGGAVAANVRIANPALNTAFPIVFAILMWLGVYLRDSRLWALVPLRDA